MGKAAKGKKRGVAGGVLLLAGVIRVCSAQDTAEEALWRLWQSQTARPDDHAAMVEACAAFEKQVPASDPLVVVAQQLRAWHLLKSGSTGGAKELLEPMLNLQGTPLRNAASEIARSWLTRLDRDRLQTALKTYYNRNIAFPPALTALRTIADIEQPPLRDRWDEPWAYRLTGFRRLPGLRDQKFELQARKLGRNSDLRKSLDIPFGSRITLSPVRVMSVAGTGGIVQFADKAAEADRNRPIHISVGGHHGRVRFPFVGQNLILLADWDHWKVCPRPRG